MRLPHSLFGLSVLFLVGAFVPVPPALAQTAPAQTVFDRLEVGVVEIDVTVRDRKRRPVAGLPRESFTVSLDGETLPITHFVAFADGLQTSAGAVTATENEPSSTRQTVGSGDQPIPQAVPSHLALFFDESGLAGGERRALVRRLSQTLESALPAEARILVAGRNGADLRVWAPFSNRAERLSEAIAEAAAGTPRSDAAAGMQDFLREVERQISLLDEAQGPSGRGTARVLAARGTAYASELLQEVERSTQVLERLVALMAGLPGRKAILYVGDTLAMNPGEVIEGALRSAFSRFGFASWTEHVDATPAFSGGSAAITRLAERASSRRVPIYTLDPTGGRLPLLASAAQSSIAAGRSGGSQPTETWTPGIASRQRNEIQGAFRMIAEASGGMLLTGQGDGVLERVFADLGTYYSVGVRAPEHDKRPALPLVIRVEGRGLEVQRRRAHRARSADQLDADRTVAALLPNLELPGLGHLGLEHPGHEGAARGPNEIGASLTAGSSSPGESSPGEAGLHDVALSIRVPVENIAVIARGRSHVGQLSIFVATSGPGLHFSEVRKIVLPITLANDELMTVAGSEAEHRLDLRLPAGPARIAVGLRDDYDPDLALLTLQLEVGARLPPAPTP